MSKKIAAHGEPAKFLACMKPLNIPPLVATLAELIPPGKIKETAEKVGCADITICHWFNRGTDPRLSLFEAALNAVGYRLEIVPLEEK